MNIPAVLFLSPNLHTFFLLKDTRFYEALWNTLIFTLGTLAPTILIGLANLVLSFLGLPALKWISSSQTAMLSVIIVTVWKSMGYAMIFYLSALEKVPEELYEASALDGAGKWKQFLSVTLPSISPTTFFLMIITMVNSLQAYDQIQILTQGGPSGSTRTLLYMYYQLGFQEYKMGQATGVAVMMIILTVFLSLLQFYGSKKWVHY